ncbi:methyltransferase type 11 [Niveomyces insectorum RCEF 264]|uniref:Methyltransferase type 11 n=1 Tax=Niveomyces insectorum RCEF 264 TaxID=1081102 RepID=A0A167VNT9_9HYPO|nr:methyltransferase type 11 [Niveomyces insectorum RCEF 264]
MAAQSKDNWSSEAYQNAASFVPKLATQVVQWLDVQKDDAILDIGCGDGVLDLQFARVLAQGTGRLHGVDSSAAMITAAGKAAADAHFTNCTFEVLDCNDLVDRPALQQGQFTKAFSNAAMHWILRPAEKLFRGVHAALRPGGVFAFEMGGLGNVAELVTGIVAGVSRRIGLAAAQAANPWFFPDETWIRATLEGSGGGWRIERVERVWRPTPADAFLDAIPDAAEREACTREVVALLEATTRQPDGSYNLNYVRLRVLARKL